MITHLQMNKFDSIIDQKINEDWKSAVAGGLMGLSSFAAAPHAHAIEQPTEITQAEETIDLLPLIKGLEAVESRCNPDAVGDNGNAKGVLQIWDTVIQDVNRIYHTNYVHDDAFDVDKARDIATKYLNFWGNQYEKRTGKDITYEVLARIWNGGPKGYAKDSTVKYWNKVKEYII